MVREVSRIKYINIGLRMSVLRDFLKFKVYTQEETTVGFFVCFCFLMVLRVHVCSVHICMLTLRVICVCVHMFVLLSCVVFFLYPPLEQPNTKQEFGSEIKLRPFQTWQ